MARKTNRIGQGFSLFDLKDDIAQVVEILGGALSRQGVTVDQDNLFIQLQSVVKSIGSGYDGYSGGPGYPAMHAADMMNTAAPYSVAGDLLAISYSHFANGDKVDAVKTMMTAMRSDDFSEIVAGLIAMNSRSDIQKRVEADDTDTDEDASTEDSEDEVEDTDSEDDSDDNDKDLTDEELEALLEDTESEDDNSESDETEESEDSTVEADDEGDKPLTETSPTTTVKKPEVKTEVVKEEEDDEEEESEGSAPMGGTSSTVTASHTAKVLANRLSLDGSRESLSKAKAFMQKHPRVGK